MPELDGPVGGAREERRGQERRPLNLWQTRADLSASRWVASARCQCTCAGTTATGHSQEATAREERKRASTHARTKSRRKARREAGHLVDRAGVTGVGLEVLFVVADRALVHGPLLRPDDVERGVLGVEVGAHAAGHARDEGLVLGVRDLLVRRDPLQLDQTPTPPRARSLCRPTALPTRSPSAFRQCRNSPALACLPASAHHTPPPSRHTARPRGGSLTCPQTPAM
eukprot:2194303-Rhodomonas_salina.1